MIAQMATKQELIDIIQKWVSADKELKELNAKSRVARATKKALTQELAKIMKDNEIDCFDINAGKITYSNRKTKSGLNKKLLVEALEEYFRESPSHRGLEREITQFILDKRKVKETDVINIK